MAFEDPPSQPAVPAGGPYRHRPPHSPTPSYLAHWQDHRRRTITFLATTLGLVVVALVLSSMYAFLFLPLSLVWVIGAGATWYRRLSLRCPRCHKFFFNGEHWDNPFARACMRCGLPFGSPCDPDLSASD